MSARPHFLRGFTPRDFGETVGHTEPAAATLPGVYVVSEDGARLDTHRVLPATDWLSDDQLSQLRDADADDELVLGGRNTTEEERQRRAETRRRLQQVLDDMRISRRQWLIWAALAAAMVLVSWLLPEPWAGYGWHIAATEEVWQ